MNKYIIGQEVICPNGFGRVSEICDTEAITVETYFNNRSCAWARDNIKPSCDMANIEMLVEVNLVLTEETKYLRKRIRELEK